MKGGGGRATKGLSVVPETLPSVSDVGHERTPAGHEVKKNRGAPFSGSTVRLGSHAVLRRKWDVLLMGQELTLVTRDDLD